MNSARIVAAVLSLSSALLAGQTPQQSATAEAQITSTLHQMYEAEKRHDLKFVLAHMSEDFAEVAGDGKIYYRSDIEARWKDVELRDYRLSDCIFKLMTSDAAYQSCNMEVEATFNGKPFPQRFRVTWVWTQQNGHWLIRFEQGTIPSEAKKQ